MITLHDHNDTNFDRLGIGSLADTVSCIVARKIPGGIYELEMHYRTGGIYADQIQPDEIIVCRPNTYDRPQPFRIRDVGKDIDGKFKIYAVHVSDRIRHVPVMPFTATGIEAALSRLSDAAVLPHPFEFYTDFTSTAAFSIAEPRSMRDAMFGTEGSLLDIYGGEWDFDRYECRLMQHIGQDRGATITYGYNMVDCKQTASLRTALTGIVPFWKPDTDGIVTLPERLLTRPNALSYGRVEVVDFSAEIQEKPTVAQLRAAAQAYLASNAATVPTVSISTSPAPIGLETVRLGDTIRVEFRRIGVSTTAEAIGYKYNVLSEQYESIDIGDVTQSFAETIANLIKAKGR